VLTAEPWQGWLSQARWTLSFFWLYPSNASVPTLPDCIRTKDRRLFSLACYLFILWQAVGSLVVFQLPPWEAGLAEGLLRWCFWQMAGGNPQGNAGYRPQTVLGHGQADV